MDGKILKAKTKEYLTAIYPDSHIEFLPKNRDDQMGTIARLTTSHGTVDFFVNTHRGGLRSRDSASRDIPNIRNMLNTLAQLDATDDIEDDNMKKMMYGLIQADIICRLFGISDVLRNKDNFGWINKQHNFIVAPRTFRIAPVTSSNYQHVLNITEC